MRRSEGWRGVRASEPSCPVLKIDRWYWDMLHTARRMEHPAWPVATMPSDLVLLCEEYHVAAAAADADQERREAKRKEMREAARKASEGRT
jgi:hypothetical protein